MRADQNFDLPALDFAEEIFLGIFFPKCPALAIRQQADLLRKILQNFSKSFKMLAGEDFGRSENGRLISGHHCFKRGNGGDHRFSRSDVALKQPVHRIIFLEVLYDLIRRFLLGVCQFERQ